MIRRLPAVLGACALLLALAARADVTASLDRDHIALGDTVQLTLEATGDPDGLPDLTPLESAFEILSRSTGSSIQMSNGGFSASREMVVVLSPRRSGHLQIPALRWGQNSSPPLAVQVDADGSSSTGGGASPRALFLQSTPGAQTPYVDSAVVLTVQLYAARPLYQADLDLPATTDVLVQPLGKDTQSTVQRGGHTYQLLTRRYLLVPLRSGPLKLPGPVLDAQVAAARGNDPFHIDPLFSQAFGNTPFGGMIHATRPIRLHGDPIQLDVRARPAGAATPWLPAQTVEVSESWTPADGPAATGEPVTLHLHLRATGTTGDQLPDLSALLKLPDGLRAYPDQAKTDTRLDGDSVVGSRDQNIALIAARPGAYTLPALTLPWWDTVANQAREVHVPAHTLQFKAAGDAAATPPPPNVAALATPRPAPASAPTPEPTPASPAPAPIVSPHAGNGRSWAWLSLALGVLWLATLLAWGWSRRRRPASAAAASSPPPAPPDRRAARAAFLAACRGQAPREARRALLAWAAAEWPDAPPPGLSALGERLGDAGLKSLLGALDRACYAGGDWQGAALAAALPALRAAPAAAKAPEGLAGLYPGR